MKNYGILNKKSVQLHKVPPLHITCQTDLCLKAWNFTFAIFPEPNN